MKKAWNHFCTVTKHRHLVMKHCFQCGIPLQGILHDLSKYSPTEFSVGAKYYAGDRSPNDMERRDKGYSEAWMHHKGRNKHHFEYWNDVNLTSKRYECVPMPKKYFVEMVCDRIAASKVYKGADYTDSAPYDYFINSNGRKQMHPETARDLEAVLRYLKENGEENTFRMLRETVRQNDQ